jgi:hypothetical protein
MVKKRISYTRKKNHKQKKTQRGGTLAEMWNNSTTWISDKFQGKPTESSTQQAPSNQQEPPAQQESIGKELSTEEHEDAEYLAAEEKKMFGKNKPSSVQENQNQSTTQETPNQSTSYFGKFFGGRKTKKGRKGRGKRTKRTKKRRTKSKQPKTMKKILSFFDFTKYK